MSITVRKVEKGDFPHLKIILDSIELFPSEMLADMSADYFDNPDSQDVWFTAVEAGTSIGIGYCAPEKLTDGTYNLYAIGIKKDQQGRGIGGKMMSYLENYLKDRNGRILIVDTSGTEAFALTRQFYKNLGFHQEAVIRDFWEEGDDKVTFWKKF